MSLATFKQLKDAMEAVHLYVSDNIYECLTTIPCFAVCSTAYGTAAKTAAVKLGTLILSDGAAVNVRFEQGAPPNTDFTLNIGNTGAKNTTYNGVDSFYARNDRIEWGQIIQFVYHSEYDRWDAVGLAP